MPNDIIDNQEAHLADAINQLLSQSQRAHFAVGYFFISGFKAIAEKLVNIHELRLLIGNTSDRATIEQLAEAHQSELSINEHLRDKQFQSAKQKNQVLLASQQSLRERLERMDQTNEDQALIEQLLRLVSEKKLKVKVYTRGRLHAKAYIFVTEHDQSRALSNPQDRLKGKQRNQKG